MSRIPEARDLVLQASLDPAMPAHLAQKLQDALHLMHRRPYAKPRAPDRSAPVDAYTAGLIREHVLKFPEQSLQQVADFFQTNPGRVSEALHHDR